MTYAGWLVDRRKITTGNRSKRRSENNRKEKTEIKKI